jgi:Ca2+-binding EF-hand superfamily protein
LKNHPKNKRAERYCTKERRAELIKIYEAMDRNGDKNLTRTEIIHACVKNHAIAKTLGLPSSLKTMDQLGEFEKFFQTMDMDGDMKITKEEFVWYFGNDLTVKT